MRSRSGPSNAGMREVKRRVSLREIPFRDDARFFLGVIADGERRAREVPVRLDRLLIASCSACILANRHTGAEGAVGAD